jgi:hypothetical protein
MRLPAPECLSLLHKLLHLSLSSACNVQRCLDAGALPRVLWLLRCVLGGWWADGWADGSTSHAVHTHPRLLVQWVVKLHAHHATPTTLHALLGCLRAGHDEPAPAQALCVDGNVDSQQAYTALVLEVRTCRPERERERETFGAHSKPTADGRLIVATPLPPSQGLATALTDSNKHPQYACFDLPGEDAHVRVTGLSHWPSQSYTWVMWFRTSDQAVATGPVPLYCMHGVDAETGVMGGLEEGAFVLHSVCAHKPVETLRVPLGSSDDSRQATHGAAADPACARAWRCLCVTHAKRSMFVKGPVAVYLDGRLLLESKLRYPTVVDTGGAAWRDSKGTLAARTTLLLGSWLSSFEVESTLQGQIGPVLLFGTAASAHEVCELSFGGNINASA